MLYKQFLLLSYYKIIDIINMIIILHIIPVFQSFLAPSLLCLHINLFTQLLLSQTSLIKHILSITNTSFIIRIRNFFVVTIFTQYVPLCTAIYHNMSHYILLYITICPIIYCYISQYVPLYTAIYHNMSHYILLYITVVD